MLQIFTLRGDYFVAYRIAYLCLITSTDSAM